MTAVSAHGPQHGTCSGVSGMIAAYELPSAGEVVVLYEAESELGGFAKSTGKDASFKSIRGAERERTFLRTHASNHASKQAEQ